MLTAEDKARVFGLYWGCECIVYSHEEGAKNDIRVVSERLLSYPLHDCQLILRPLSKISDEDAVEVAKIILSKGSEWQPIEIVRWDWCTKIIVKIEPGIMDAETTIEMYISIVNEGDIEWTWDYKKGNSTGMSQQHCPNVSHAYDFLRSRGYALPYKGIDLFEAGIAIEQP